MTNPTPGPASPEDEAVGIAVVLGREIKMKRMSPDQLLGADLMARRLQRLSNAREEGEKFAEGEWEKFLNGTRKLLDWVSGQFYNEEDLEWFEENLLMGNLTLNDIGPLMQAMGAVSEQEETKSTNRKARRAK